MAELARGTIADRPWGRTLGTLAQRGFTGQLDLAGDGKWYQVAFVGGAVAGAVSPLASDAAVRVAMTSGLVSSTQVNDIVRRAAAAPQRDEIEIIAEAIRLGPDHAMRLRRRVVAQRAARTFSVDRGEFILGDQIGIPAIHGSELDVRGVIYYGARQNFTEARLAAELAAFGSWYRLREQALEDLPQYGFGGDPAEHAVLERMRQGASLGELERLADPRTARAMVYALVSCNACDVDGPAPRAAVPSPTVATADGSSRTVHQPSAMGSGGFDKRAMAELDAPTIRKLDVPPRAPSVEEATSPGAPAFGLDAAPAFDAPTTRAPSPRRRPVDTQQAETVRALIAQHTKKLQAGASHYELIGVAPDAPPEQIRKAYFSLARQLHPDRLSALGLTDQAQSAHKLFASVNTAFGVLSDPARRAEYTQILRRGGEAAIRAEQAEAEALAARIMDAEEAFRRGEMLLRRDQLADAAMEFQRAVQLNPEEADYWALHAWAKFLAAPNRETAAVAARNDLGRAIAKGPQSPTARLYLGRVERMLGYDRDALRIFREVIQLSPHHSEAHAEIRVIEQRLNQGQPPRKR